jgi:WD40 repeat protein
MQEGIHGSDNVLPENGYAQRVQVKQQNGSMKRKTNDGSFGIPDGAVIRSKGYSELWTARRRSKELKDTDLDVERKKETGQNVRTSINCLSVQRSKDRSHVIVGTGCGDVRVVDLGTSRTVPNIEKGETLAQLSEIVEPLLLEGHEGYVSSAIGVGQLCFTGSLDASIRGWKYGSMEEVVKSNGHKSAVHDICYSCSKRCIYSASSDGTVRVWDLAKGKSNILCEHFECACYSIAISEKRGGQLFVGLDSGSIGVIDAVSGAVISDLKGHSSMVASLCFSPNSDLLVSGSSDGKCRIYFAGTSIVHYQHHDCPVYAVAFVQNGKCVVSGGTDGAIHRWSSATGVCQSVYRHFDQDTIFDLAFHAGKLLVGGRDGVLRCWEPSTSCEFCEQICGKNSSSDGCDWEKVECTNSCGIICYRFELALHLNQCINRKLRCSNPGCREVMMFKDLEKHQKDICPCARVKCPNSKINGGWGCDEVMRRRNLATHLIECYDPKLKGLKKKEEKNDGNRLSSSTIDRAPSPGMKGRKAKLNLPSMNKSTKGSRMKGSGVRVRIPLRSSAAGRKFQREQLNNRQKGSK